MCVKEQAANNQDEFKKGATVALKDQHNLQSENLRFWIKYVIRIITIILYSVYKRYFSNIFDSKGAKTLM